MLYSYDRTAYGPMNYGRVFHISPGDARKATQDVVDARKVVEAVIKKFLQSRKFFTKAIPEFETPLADAFREYARKLHEGYYTLGFSAEDPKGKSLFDKLLDVESQVSRFGSDSLYELNKAINRYPDGTDFTTAFKAERVKWAKVALSILDLGAEALEAYSEYGQKLTKKQVDPNPESVEEFSLGSVRFVVVDSKATEADIREYVASLKEAWRLLEASKLGKLWYGLVYLSPHYAEMSDFEKKQYSAYGYNIDSAAGTFHTGQDVIAITTPSSREALYVIIHELGHRYWYKFLRQGQRARYENFLEGVFSQLHALLLNADKLSEEEAVWVSGLYQQHERGMPVSNKDRKAIQELFERLHLRAGLAPATSYGKSNVEEAFAEHFQSYLFGKTNQEHSEFFRTMLAGEVSLEERVASSYLDRVARHG